MALDFSTMVCNNRVVEGEGLLILSRAQIPPLDKEGQNGSGSLFEK
jgi:hypothetical protein